MPITAAHACPRPAQHSASRHASAPARNCMRAGGSPGRFQSVRGVQSPKSGNQCSSCSTVEKFFSMSASSILICCCESFNVAWQYCNNSPRVCTRKASLPVTSGQLPWPPRYFPARPRQLQNLPGEQNPPRLLRDQGIFFSCQPCSLHQEIALALRQSRKNTQFTPPGQS